MFGLFKKKTFWTHEHTTEREDWENLMDELFSEVTGKSRNGLAVVSNTVKQGSDSKGTLIEKLSTRLKPNLDPEVHLMIHDLTRDNFNNIFQLAQKQRGIDIYSIKNLGLPNNCLVFPVQSKVASKKKALLLFEGPFVQDRLVKTLKSIREILDHAIKRPVQKHDPVLTPSGEIPPSISKRAIHKTDDEVIKARLTYLEDADSRTSAEKEEMKNLKQYVEQAMRGSFR